MKYLNRTEYLLIPGMSACLIMGILAPSTAMAGTVSYDRDVLPIISEKCFSCHGPDEKTRKKGLRFDTRVGLLESTTRAGSVVTPGDALASVLYQRITETDPDKRMPPSDSHLSLKDSEIAVIEAWITEGAPWQGHWAFVPPEKTAPPEVQNAPWCRSPIDQFILARLESAGLEPAPEAPREVLIRRVSLDLTGLPPTPDEVDAFLSDTSDGAYENMVDRLLSSSHYGERMAFLWLDAARYSDTNGYQRDTKRTMWPWRDWVINAFNQNMPFDEFTIEQLAGDLMPDATRAQKIATGFNRNHRINGEGGIIPEEYAVEYVVDRVDTTSTTWMGLTMGCARCHDHKFDPLTQKEFYQLYAFFNQVPENGKGEERGNDVPFIAVPTEAQTARKLALAGEIAEKEGVLDGPDERLDALQTAWESTLSDTFAVQAWSPVGTTELGTRHGATLRQGDDGVYVAEGENPDHEVYELRFTAAEAIGAFKLDLFTDSALPEGGPGRGPNGNVVISEFEVERSPAGTPDYVEPLKIATALADYAQEDDDYRVVNAIDGNSETGWATGSQVKRENRTAIFVLDEAAAIEAGDQVIVRIRQESPYGQHTLGRFALAQSPSREIAHWARPELGIWHHVGPFFLENKDNGALLDMALPPESGQDLAATFADGSLHWEARSEWEDGTIIPLAGKEQLAHYLYRKVTTSAPSSLKLSLGSNDAIKVWVDGELRHENNVGRTVGADQDQVSVFLEAGEHDLLVKIVNYGGEAGFYFRVVDDGGQSLLALMEEFTTPRDAQTPEQRKKFRDSFRARDSEWVAKRDALEALTNEQEALDREIVTTMVMEDMETPRPTYLLQRGAYDAPAETQPLTADVPAQLGGMDESLPRNRLGLAQWLLRPEHPLTSRVRVNLYWQQFFGRGIVKTSEDFGTQGTPPSHPELLDWLATTFVESGWDVKAMQKRIVMSATYRQSSVLTAAHREKDPENILLGRAPRLRLPAEMLRDQALTVSGLLNEEIGGPSVFPYQPEGMWSALTFQNMNEYSTNFYTPDTGNKVYRRGLYTFWKRTIVPPRMQIFDAAGRERCTVRKETTNTPMQALVLLNDPTFVEAARSLAMRMIDEGGDRAADRIRYGYRLALAQQPSLEKQEVFLGGLSDYQAHFSADPEAAAAFLSVGDTVVDETVPPIELAAYTAVASVMLNLDEMITRE